MTINEIIKKAVERIKRESRQFTPDNYAEIFCDEAKKAGIIIEDCNQVDKFLGTLNSDIQLEIKQYRIRTMQELLRFLISKINRMQPTKSSQTIDTLNGLIKRVLQSMQMMHNSDATELAGKTIDMLDKQASPEQIELFRDAWTNFLTLYDNTFLQKLAPLGTVYEKDLKKTIEGLRITGTVTASVTDLRHVASLVIASLAPSIAPSVNDEIAQVSDTIRNDPSLLTSPGVAEDIKQAIKLRIALDKASLRDMIIALDSVLDKLSVQLIELIERSDISTVEIQQIKYQLEDFDERKEPDFQSAHRKLFAIAVALEEKTERLSGDLQVHNKEVNELSSKVARLEQELEAAQKASSEDFLTKLFNRRALDDFTKVKEGEFERYGRNFTVILFDLDFFKKINDKYGHDAGDAVLSGFGQILKKLCRNVDVVGRYGGEEFMALLSDTDLEGGLKFAEKVRYHVEHSRFMYKGQRMEVTVSGGAAQRKDFPSVNAAVKSADQRLYDAKAKGRNRIEPSA